jgi:signal transduction histidine kinase
LPNLLERINSKILSKITLLVIIEIILIVGSFGVLAYFQSQQSTLGNSINIAGKNRYLTASLLSQTERYLDGTSDASQLKAALNSLHSNIITLKEGGMISGVDLKPLPSDFFNLWSIVNENWNLYNTRVAQKILMPSQQIRPTTRTIDQVSLKKQFESMASDLIVSSDKLVTQLGLQADKNSNDLMVCQIVFGIVVFGIQILILYLVARILEPIFDLTRAASKIDKGNFDVTVRQKGSDELSVLTHSFNSMTASMKDQNALTRKLEAANEELKNMKHLKDQFINVAAHELRTPIQPILGLSQLLLSKTGSIEQYSELLDSINRNAKRLGRLSDDILDVTRIESKSLELKKERFNVNNIIINAIDDVILGKSFIDSKNVQLLYQPQDIELEADKGIPSAQDESRSHGSEGSWTDNIFSRFQGRLFYICPVFIPNTVPIGRRRLTCGTLI